MSTPIQSLSLYGIELALLELLEHRDYIADCPPGGDINEDERADLLRVADERIEEYVRKELTKVDGVVHYLQEFQRRADIEDDELKRIKARRDRWQAYHDRLEQRVIAAMQLAGKKELRGERETLKLAKNPPAVDVRQEGLVPEEFQRCTLALDMDVCQAIALTIAEQNDDRLLEVFRAALLTAKIEPQKSEIAKVLKSTTPCPKCGNESGLLPGRVWTSENRDETGPCETCGGTGKVSGSVPGCVLVTDKQRLVIE